MIRINLLPPELRTAERTPLGRFVAMIAMIVVVLGVGFGVVDAWMKVGQAEEKLKAAKDSLATLQKTVKEKWEPLTQELATLNKRAEAKKAVEAERRIGGMYPWMWTQAIDEVWYVIWKAPKVWIMNINCMEGGGAAGLPAGTKVEATFSMDCYAATKDFNGMTEFRRKLNEHPMVPKRFKFMNKPTSVTVEADPQSKEGGKVRFRIELYAVSQPDVKK